MPPVIDEESCTACGTCVEVCPEDVYCGVEDGAVPSPRYPDECWHCASCVVDCPVGAIRLRLPIPMRPWVF